MDVSKQYIYHLLFLDKSFIKVFLIILISSIIELMAQFSFLTSVIYLNFIVPIVSSITLISSFAIFIINPGIIYSDKKNGEKLYCNDCQFLYPKSNKKMEHCYICKVCVCKLDHHCDVIEKCIGKYNYIFFILFVLSSFIFMFCFFAILLNLLKLNTKQRK